MRVRRELRAHDDGYRSALAPGLHASDDAARLAEEIAFASGRLLALHAAPPGLFDEIRALARKGELERATWMCFLTVYLSPLQGDDPFAGIRLALARDGGDGSGGEGVPSLDGIPLGPRTSHDPARGPETLLAYRHWVSQLGSQARAFTGEDSWTPQRRFERVFERLALPGLGRMGRYELLVTLGRLGLYELDADSLHLAVGRGAGSDDLTTVAAKRVLGDRRANLPGAPRGRVRRGAVGRDRRSRPRLRQLGRRRARDARLPGPTRSITRPRARARGAGL